MSQRADGTQQAALQVEERRESLKDTEAAAKQTQTTQQLQKASVHYPATQIVNKPVS